MKYRIATVAALAAALSLPVPAHAEELAASPQAVTAEKPAAQPFMGNMNCPMMESMQKNMGSMMGDMNSMMQMMSDPAMKERMQKIHENMGAMMQQMMAMQKNMGGMMQGGNMGGKITNEAPAAAAPEVKDPHHPDKQ